jgi:hypothetical protein
MNYTEQQVKQVIDFWVQLKNEIDSGKELNVGIRPYRTMRIKKDGKVVNHSFDFITEIIHIRSPFITNRIVLFMLKEQPYYIGLHPNFDFDIKRTSALCFDYEKVSNIFYRNDKNGLQ